MDNLENIKFQKISTTKFSEQDRKDLAAELKKRSISFRLTATSILFDERYLKAVKDLVPASLR